MSNRSLKKKDTLLESLVLYTRLFHKPFSSESLLSGLPIGSNLTDQMLFSKTNSKSLFSRAASRAGLKTTIIEKPIKDILALQLPVILLLSNENSCILENFNDDKTKAKVIFAGVEDPLEEWVEVEKLEQKAEGSAGSQHPAAGGRGNARRHGRAYAASDHGVRRTHPCSGGKGAGKCQVGRAEHDQCHGEPCESGDRRSCCGAVRALAAVQKNG